MQQTDKLLHCSLFLIFSNRLLQNIVIIINTTILIREITPSEMREGMSYNHVLCKNLYRSPLCQKYQQTKLCILL